METLTHRERILAVVQGRELDRVPFITYDYEPPAIADVMATVGPDRIGLLRWSAIHRVVHPHCCFIDVDDLAVEVDDKDSVGDRLEHQAHVSLGLPQGFFHAVALGHLQAKQVVGLGELPRSPLDAYLQLLVGLAQQVFLELTLGHIVAQTQRADDATRVISEYAAVPGDDPLLTVPCQHGHGEVLEEPPLSRHQLLKSYPGLVPVPFGHEDVEPVPPDDVHLRTVQYLAESGVHQTDALIGIKTEEDHPGNVQVCLGQIPML